MALYIAVAGYNMYLMMFPLARLDISDVAESDLVKPLWDDATQMDMRV